MTKEAERWVPLAAIAALTAPEPGDEADLPIAYIPRRIPEGVSYREVLERSVNWGRR